MNAKKLCELCQAFGDHWTKNCPFLICDECDEKGHCKKYCPYLKHSEEEIVENPGIKVEEIDKCLWKLKKQTQLLKGKLLKLQTLYSLYFNSLICEQYEVVIDSKIFDKLDFQFVAIDTLQSKLESLTDHQDVTEAETSLALRKENLAQLSHEASQLNLYKKFKYLNLQRIGKNGQFSTVESGSTIEIRVRIRDNSRLFQNVNVGIIILKPGVLQHFKIISPVVQHLERNLIVIKVRPVKVSVSRKVT